MDLFKLFGTIAIKNKDAVDALKETGEEGEKAESRLKKAFDKMGHAAVVVGKTIAKGLMVAGAGLVAIVTQSTKAYAEYEQLVGGVNKLFGDSSDTVMKYAQDAYKNAGISANDYMTQITSFSASLISSLGGDTEEAARIGNMAIEDMSDNANVFGSSIEDIQNAYNGFAKSNYTMLDNLNKMGALVA